VIDRFTEVIGFDRFAVYVFDYGAPTKIAKVIGDFLDARVVYERVKRTERTPA
jgi:hypothetical protein